MIRPKTSKIYYLLTKKQLFKRYFMAIIGIFLFACSYNLFLVNNEIVTGGITGLAIITKSIIEPSLMILILSVILLITSYFLLGKEKTVASIIGSLLLPVFVKITSNIGDFIIVNNEDLLLITIFAGVSTGISLGLILKNGFTTGGTDIVNKIVSKYLKLSIGNCMLITDGLIVLLGGITFGWTKAMYAIIALYIFSLMVDRVILGISASKAFYIVTAKDEEVKEYILGNLSHGVTILKAKGGYSGSNKNVLMCVVPTKEYFRLKEGISLIDEEAFFVITDSYEVMGGA